MSVNVEEAYHIYAAILLGAYSLSIIIISYICINYKQDDRAVYLIIIVIALTLRLLHLTFAKYGEVDLFGTFSLSPWIVAFYYLVMDKKSKWKLVNSMYVVGSIVSLYYTLTIILNESSLRVQHTWPSAACIMYTGIILLIMSIKDLDCHVNLIIIALAALDIIFQSTLFTTTGFLVLGIKLIFTWIQGYKALEDNAAILSVRLQEKMKRETELNQRVQQSKKREDDVWTAYLQAQIKPHFIFNVLNSISTLCKKDAQQAYEMTMLLAKYLRYTIDFKNIEELVPIQKEIDLTMDYAEIEKKRFTKILIIFDVDIEGVNAYIPPFCIQPLVENAIRHGLKSQGNAGDVHVIVSETHNSVHVAVSNSGEFDVDLMYERINNIQNSNGVGLFNVNARLVSFFGKGLSFSVVNHCSNVYFEIPVSEEEIDV
jgi:hypothetical protein